MAKKGNKGKGKGPKEKPVFDPPVWGIPPIPPIPWPIPLGVAVAVRRVLDDPARAPELLRLLVE